MGSPASKRTEADMLELLRERYTHKAGNGDAWAFATHVRNAAGFDASRTLDALAMSLWPSRGLLLHGFEVKCSRRDWLTELRKPEKAEAFGRLLDRFYLVVSDAAIVKPGELPSTWGLLVVQGGRLVQKVDAPPLRESSGAADAPLPEGFDRSFLAALLRATARANAGSDEELQAAAERGRKLADENWQRRYGSLEEQLERVRENERRFTEITGVPMSMVYDYGRLEDVAKAVKLAYDGEATVDMTERRLRSLSSDLRRQADNIDKTLDNADADR